ncbi:acyl-CoA dehydrogenase family protein [Aquamicrobium sp. LC103]|uniref:acyl-CoA dehydrogenase family protein n=1 Tax=Aquamicrobium sp. LC103 TaxID=1120658 RepID=UPI00063EB1F4|nr:acyl-CoA dehydrogenase family protein [Aquamicrobium sp. LC103]TKT78382.1 acyl-CoA dehydrogenase [Aquamicrobium sp. LC103]
MRFYPNEDQTAFLAVLDQLAQAPQAAWKAAPEWARFDWSPELDMLLDENGFFDCAAEETLGLVTAAMLTYRIAGLPVLVECAASSMLRSLYAPDLPRPIAVIEERGRPVPFLPVARSAILVSDESVRGVLLEEGVVETVESIFAYPMGVLGEREVAMRPIDADPAVVRNTWRVALAAEMAGTLKGGLDAVVAHVRDRHQFGRPLGSFQAIQHRLAGAATKVEASYWLTLKAAQSLDPIDTAIALGHVQEASTRVVYDLHQFMGAMGLTLEHPLHRWTYRARLLRSALGGAGTNFRAVSASRWRAA